MMKADKKQRAKRGEAATYLSEKILPYEGDECQIWPFAMHTNGYPKFKKDGKAVLLHREVCEKANGAAPTSNHEAAHVCGNNGCLTKRHLSWKTRRENEDDKILHKTRCRISRADFLTVKAMAGTHRQVDIAAALGMSQGHVSRIIRGENSEAGRR